QLSCGLSKTHRSIPSRTKRSRLCGGKKHYHRVSLRRWTMDRVPALAAELARLKVDMIVIAGGNATVSGAKQAIESVPIIMANVQDPVGSGFVASLARPGGNITGLSALTAELAGKRLDLIRETFPRVSRVAALFDPQ